eukprot:gene13872-18378_t
MARSAAAEGSAQARQLDQVIQAALRGKGVIERILAFSRSGVRPPADFLAQPVIEQVLGLLAATLPEGAHVQPDLAAPQARLRGDAAAWFEAVMNLCTNGLQALQGAPGVLAVSLHRETLHAPRPTSHGHAPAGDLLVLRVADTGVGIAPELMDRLFDPFFTTRGQQGTGLGLAVVHGVVEALGGAVDVQSRPGEGSCFTLYLPTAASEHGSAAESVNGSAEGTAGGPPPGDTARPIATAAAPPLQEDTAGFPHAVSAEVPSGQGQAILVVDDEPALVALAEEMLA